MAAAAVQGFCVAVPTRRSATLRPPGQRVQRSVISSKQPATRRAAQVPPPMTAVAAAGEGRTLDPAGSGADVDAPRGAKVSIQELFTDYLFDIPPAHRGHAWSEEDASGLLDSLLDAVPAAATDAEALPPHGLGRLLLTAYEPRAAGQQQRRRVHIVDGEQHILTLCLLLAAARARLLESSSAAGYQTAKQLKQLLMQSGDIVEGLPEELGVRLGSEEETGFLRRLLLEPDCLPGRGELAGEAQRRLWACRQLFRQRLAELDLPRLQLLVQFILSRSYVTVTTLPTAAEALSLFLACASLPELVGRGWALGHLPDGGDQLAACADIIVILHGRLLPLHSAVLAAGCRTLRQALAAAGSAASKAAAVQGAFEGQPLADAQLFLRCLYSSTAAVDSVGDPWSLAGVAALADKLDAPAVLQACDARLCSLLGPSADWAAWLVLADRYGLRQLRWAAAESVLTVLVKHSSKEERREALGKLGGLSAGTYRLLFETTLETAASYRAELACWQGKA
ncbi:hypothetical protein ABPG75_000109 [Micractinium tetrahymenae]